MKSKVLFIVGPTASGKTEVALALAERMPVEIISADSMQVYRRMDIGTAKPDRAQREKIPHHLIDIVEPSQEYSVHEYRLSAVAAIRDIVQRGKIPLVAGGSGLYIQSVLEGLSAQPGAVPQLRDALEKQALDTGLNALYDELRAKDPEAALKIKPTDKRRIIRALEIIRSSGKPPSEWYRERVSLKDLGFESLVIGLDRPRTELYEAIGRRVEDMFRRGLLDEAKALFAGPLSRTARQAVGYKEIYAIYEMCGSEPDEDMLGKVKENISRNTRNLAKRQLTWFRKSRLVRWIPVSSGQGPSDIASQIEAFY